MHTYSPGCMRPEVSLPCRSHKTNKHSYILIHTCTCMYILTRSHAPNSVAPVPIMSSIIKTLAPFLRASSCISNLYINMCVCVCVCVCIRTYVRTYIHTCMVYKHYRIQNTRVSQCRGKCAYIHTHSYAHALESMLANTSAMYAESMCVHIYVCM